MKVFSKKLQLSEFENKPQTNCDLLFIYLFIFCVASQHFIHSQKNKTMKSCFALSLQTKRGK